MSLVHLHLLVNHVPIIGAFFALALLVLSLRWGGDVLKRAALLILVSVALFAVTAWYTGDPAEDAVRGLPGITRAAIHAHEDMADKAFAASCILGVAALFVLVRYRNAPLPGQTAVASLAGTVVVAALMAYTGLLGGQVRHTEVRTNATPADAALVEPPRVRPPGPPKD